MLTITRLTVVELVEMACAELGLTQKAIYDAAGVPEDYHARWKYHGVSSTRRIEDKIIDAIERLQKRKQRKRKNG